MALARDLLNQAQQLANKEPKNPRQASLRRAVSAAFYALFHLLVGDAARTMAPGPDLEGVRHLMSRAFRHVEMREASKPFAVGTLPAHLDSALGSPQIPSDLQSVAEAFVELQQARHEADHDTSCVFTRQEAVTLVEQAENAFEAWKSVRPTAIGKAYLHSLYAWNKGCR